MRRTRLIKKNLDNERAILDLIQAYEEISALRMRKIKRNVLSNREFMTGLNTAFGYISYAYNVFREKFLKKGKGAYQLFNTNGKTLLVFLSANSSFYGSIIRDVFDVYKNDVANSTADCFVVGSVGKRLFDMYLKGKNYKYLEISDYTLSSDSLKSFMDVIMPYSNVIVYHGVFKSILKQEPQRTLVTGRVLELEQRLDVKDILTSQDVSESPKNFLFEPSVEYIGEFFEKQILSLLVEQTLYESNLSKYAARMLNLDASSHNIEQRINRGAFDLTKFKHKEANMRLQVSVLGGLSWKK